MTSENNESENKGAQPDRAGNGAGASGGSKALAAAVVAKDQAAGWLLLAPGEANRYVSRLSRRTLAWLSIGFAAVVLLSLNVITSTIFRGTVSDLTANSLFTISDSTKRVLGKLEERIDVRVYYSSRLGDASPTYKRYFGRVRALLERYMDMAGNKLRVSFIDPEPFSDAEDRAVSAGLQGVQLNTQGDKGYFGLVATNSTDNTETVAFFSPQRESYLEYDMTKLIHKLAVPKKMVVGLMSPLKIGGGFNMRTRQRTQPWEIVKQIGEFFDVRPVAQDVKAIDKDIDVLMIVQPHGLTEEAAFAIDQFALKGGRILAFIDPVPDVGRLSSRQVGGGTLDKEFAKLLKAWGVAFDPTKVVGDIAIARRVQTGGARSVVTEYVAWLGLKEKANIDAGDVISDGVKLLHMASAGFLSRIQKAKTKFQPLLSSSNRAMAIDAKKLTGGEPDPVGLLREYKVGGTALTIGARVTGVIKTAFPNGAPKPKVKKADGGKGNKAQGATATKIGTATKALTTGKLNAIIIADSDFLFDQFWIQTRQLYGQSVKLPIAHNGVYVVNALENLSGGEALSGLRGRGVDSRPFETVEKIRRAAEKEFRNREKALSSKLDKLRKQLSQVQKRSSSGGLVLSDKDKAAIEKFKSELVDTRQKLRSVKHAMRADIESLEGRLKFINIAAVPLLIGFGGIAFAAFRRRRRRSMN